MEIKTFWHHFLLNKTTRFVQNDIVSFIVIKHKTLLFWRHCLPSSSSGRATGKGRRFFPLLYNASLSLSLSLSHFPKKPTQCTPLRGLPPWWKGQRRQALRAATQWPPSHLTRSTWLDRVRVALSSFPPYKYPLTKRWEGGRKRNMKKQKKNQRMKRDEKKKEKEENRGWKVERNINEEKDEDKWIGKKRENTAEKRRKRKRKHI